MSQSINRTSSAPAPTMPTPPSAPKESTWYETSVKVLSGGVGGALGIYAATPAMYLKMYTQELARNPQTPFQKNPAKWFTGGAALAGWMFPQAAFAFATNEKLRQKLSNNGERELTAVEKLACSGATGAALTPFVNGQELIWTQQQKSEEARLILIKENKLDPKKVPSKTSMQIASEIYKNHGMKGFSRGAAETMGREIASASVLTNLVSEYPILAPALGATISQPLDTRKTYKQADFNYIASIGELFRPKAFKGLVGRGLVYGIFMNVAPYVKNKCQEMALPKVEEVE